MACLKWMLRSSENLIYMYCYMWMVHVKNHSIAIPWDMLKKVEEDVPSTAKRFSVCWIQCVRSASKRVGKPGYFRSWLSDKLAGKIWLPYYGTFPCQIFIVSLLYTHCCSYVRISNNSHLQDTCKEANVLKVLQQCVY